MDWRCAGSAAALLLVFVVLGMVLAVLRWSGSDAFWWVLTLVVGWIGFLFWVLRDVGAFSDGNGSSGGHGMPRDAADRQTIQVAGRTVDRAAFEAASEAVERTWAEGAAAKAGWVCVYFIENGRGHVKVGRSRHPDQRLRSLQTGSSERLVLAFTAWFRSDDEARACEAALHACLADRRVLGEWFAAVDMDYGTLVDGVS